MKNLNEKQVRSIEDAFANRFNICFENIAVEGKLCRYAFFSNLFPNFKHTKLGITIETYTANKAIIEQARESGLVRKSQEIMKSGWVVKTLTNRILGFSTTDNECGIDYFSLNVQLSYPVWNEIKQFFIKLSKSDFDEEDFEGRWGWQTAQPDKVQKILEGLAQESVTGKEKICIAEILTEQEKQKVAAKEHVKLLQIKQKLIAEITDAFRDAEIPDPSKEAPAEASKYIKGFKKMTIEGERIDNPFYQEDIYGGGEWFILQPRTYLWRINNNGSDGADWGRNNVATGAAGAIGYRLKWSDTLAEKIRALKKDKENA